MNRRTFINHAKRVIPMSDSSVSIKPEDIQPTVLPDAFIQSDIVRKLNTLSLPRYDQLPNVTLYRDQVIEYVALWMEPLSICVEQPIITPSMINNYVKGWPSACSGQKAIWPRADCPPDRYLHL